jgi:hypothetical protein
MCFTNIYMLSEGTVRSARGGEPKATEVPESDREALSGSQNAYY